MSHFFRTLDGRVLNSNLVQAAQPRPGGGWLLTLRGGYLPIEVLDDEFMGDTSRLVKAGRTEIAIGPDGLRRRVLWWRIRRGDPIAEPVLGLVIDDRPIFKP